MRILIISNIIPYLVGGAQVQARLLAEELCLMGHDIIIAGEEIVTGRLKIENRTIETVKIKMLPGNRITRAAGYFFSLFQILITRRFDYDIIYCRFIREPAVAVTLLKWLKILNKPLVAVPACSGYIGDIAFLKKFPFYKFLFMLLKKYCNRINIISKGIEDELVKEGFCRSRFSYITNGIRLEAGCSSIPKKIIQEILYS